MSATSTQSAKVGSSEPPNGRTMLSSSTWKPASNLAASAAPSGPPEVRLTTPGEGKSNSCSSGLTGFRNSSISHLQNGDPLAELVEGHPALRGRAARGAHRGRAVGAEDGREHLP